MKRVWTGLCVALLALGAHAADVKLAWNASANAIGYKLHVGTASGSYTQHIDVGAVTAATVPSLAAGTKYYFAASAYNTVGESGYSNEATAVAPVSAGPPVPTGIKPSGKLMVTANVGAVDSAAMTINASTAVPCTLANGVASCPYQSRFFDAAGNWVVTLTSTLAGAKASASATFAVGAMACSTAAGIKNGADYYIPSCKRTWTRK